MTSINPSGRNMIKHESDMSDVVVKSAIALVTIAIFLGAYLQFEAPIWQALAAAIGVYVSLMALHTLVHRSARIELLAKDVVRLESEVANLTGREPGPGPLPEPRWQAPRERGAASLPGVVPVAKTEADPFGGLSNAQERSQQPEPPVAAPPVLPSSSLTPPPADPTERPPQPGVSVAAPPAHVSNGLATPPVGGSPLEGPGPRQTKNSTRWPISAPAPLKDSWAFRPASGAQSNKPIKRDEVSQTSEQSEDDLQAVQGMLKKLANEVDVAEDAPGNTVRSERRHDSGMKASVDALHSAAESMRAAVTKAPLPHASARTQEIKPPAPPPIVSTHARLSTLGEAISANRVDVFLGPIMGLAEKKSRHHDVIVRLRDSRGVLLPGSLRDPALSKTGLVPLLDSVRLKHAVKIAASLSTKGRKGSVFVATNAESLNSNQFLDAFADAYRSRHELVGELVLFFSQLEVATFGPVQWGALTEMRDLGFRFGLEGVNDANFEFKALSAAGFVFLKLDADVFEKGLSTSNGLVPANDICRYLGDFGLTLIVGDIDQEAKRTKVLNFGAPLGQGPLFGAPQAIAPQRSMGAGNAAA